MDKTDEVKERVKNICMGFGDGMAKFHTRDITYLHNQLEIEEAQNSMLIGELSDCETSNTLLTNQNEEFKSELLVLNERQERLEELLAPHQELTQWIEEELGDDDVMEVSHDFLQILYNKVHKINH